MNRAPDFQVPQRTSKEKLASRIKLIIIDICYALCCYFHYVYNGINPLKAFFSINLSLPGAYPEIWIGGGVKGWGLVPFHPLGSPPLPVPPFPLEVGPLNPARWSGGALLAPPAGSGAEPSRNLACA